MKGIGLKMGTERGQKGGGRQEYREESKEAQGDEKKPCLVLQRCFAFMISQSVFYIPSSRARSPSPC